MGPGAMMGRASVPRIRRDRREKRLVKPATWQMTPPQNELDHLFPDRAADGLMLKEQPSPWSLEDRSPSRFGPGTSETR